MSTEQPAKAEEYGEISRRLAERIRVLGYRPSMVSANVVTTLFLDRIEVLNVEN